MRLVRWLTVLSLPALALRIVYIIEIRKVLFFDHPVLDALEYVKWGREIASGQLLWADLRIHGPLYPVFLGAVFAVSPDNYLLVGILQSIVGVASAWIAAMIARELIEGLIAPVVAFCCIAFGWIFVYYDGQWMPTTFVVFFDLLGAWMTLKAWGEGAKYRHAVGAGLAFAASALAWGPGIAFLPVAVLGIAFSRPPSLAAWKQATVCLLAAGALLAPVLAWNHHIAGQWTLTQGNAWLNVYIGNHPRADGLPSVRPGIEWEDLTTAGSTHPPYYQDRVLDYWTNYPTGALRLTGRKVLLFLSNAEVCPSQDIALHRDASLALSLPWLPSGVLLPLGILGLGAGMTTARGRRAVALSLAALATPIAFSVCSRYRLPFEALSAPLAGLLVARCAGHAWHPVARVAAAVVAVGLGWLSRDDPAGAASARLFRTHDYAARELLELGRVQEALVEIDRERRVNPNDPEVLYDQAVLWYAAGDPEAGHRILERIDRGGGLRAFTYRAWRQVRWATERFLRQGQPASALAVTLYDDGRGIPQERAGHPVVRSAAGEALRQLGRLDEAIDLLGWATRAQPPIPDAWVSLGAALGQKGEYEESARVSEEAVRLAPGNAQAWYNLAVAYHLLKRKDDAIRAATRARALGHNDAEKLLRVLGR